MGISCCSGEFSLKRNKTKTVSHLVVIPGKTYVTTKVSNGVMVLRIEKLLIEIGSSFHKLA